MVPPFLFAQAWEHAWVLAQQGSAMFSRSSGVSVAKSRRDVIAADDVFRAEGRRGFGESLTSHYFSSGQWVSAPHLRKSGSLLHRVFFHVRMLLSRKNRTDELPHFIWNQGAAMLQGLAAASPLLPYARKRWLMDARFIVPLVRELGVRLRC